MRGDILVPASGAGPDSAFFGALWPQGVLYYVFDSNVTEAHRAIFRSAVRQWQTDAGVFLVEGPGAGAYATVQTLDGVGCGSSPIGYLGGGASQDITIGTAESCWIPAVILHEVGHSLGLAHEQSRSDRDAFISLVDNGVVEWCGQATFDANWGVFPTSNASSYDFASVMHYPHVAFLTCQQHSVSVTINAIATQPAGDPPGSENACTTIDECDAAMGAGTSQNQPFPLSPRDRFGMAGMYGYRLEVTKRGNGNGTVTVDGAFDSCGPDCYRFVRDSIATVTAAPGADSIAFLGGDCSGHDACNLAMTANRSTTVTFLTKKTLGVLLRKPVKADSIFQNGFD